MNHAIFPNKVRIDGVEFSHGLSKAQLTEALDLVQSARAKVNGRLKMLRTCIGTGDETGELATRQWLLTSSEALLASAIAANKKLRPGSRRSLESCLSASVQIDFSAPIPEPVHVRFKPKKDGWRPILNHGLHHRTAQHSCVRVLSKYLKPKPFQFTHSGVHTAIKQIRAAIDTDHHYAGRLDIKQFFASFDPEELADQLPLPTEVVEHAVIGRHMEVQVDTGAGRRKIIPSLLPLLTNLLPPGPPGNSRWFRLIADRRYAHHVPPCVALHERCGGGELCR